MKSNKQSSLIGRMMNKNIALSALVMSMSQLVSAQVGITQIIPMKAVDQGTELRIKFDGLPVQPKAYQLENPARLVLDFNNTNNQLPTPTVAVNTSEVSQVETLSDAERTRLTLNLNQFGPFTTRVEGNNLIVKVLPIGANTSAATSVASRQMTTGLTNISFNRGSAQEGLLKLDLVSEQTPIDIKQQGSKIVIRLLGSHIPTHLARRLNVNEFATPVTVVDAYNEGSTGVIVVQTNGDYEYMAYQTGDKMTISVKRPLDNTTDVIAKLRTPPKYTGKKVSLDFQDIEVRRVLQLLADFTDVNMVAADSVQGQITIRLKEVPWDQALDIILKSKNLDKRRNGNVIWIAPATEITKAEEEETKLILQNLKRAPLQTEYIQLSYAKAADVEKLISVRTQASTTTATGNSVGTSTGFNPSEEEFSGSLLSSRGSVTTDARTNTIIINDTAQKVDQIRKMIALIDVPVKQVMIEARVVRATNNFSKEMGVKWGILSQGITNNNNLLVGGSNTTLWNLRKPAKNTDLGGYTYTIETPANLNVDLGATNPAGRIALSLIKFSDFMLDLELSAAQAEGLTEIVSTPKVLTADKQTATIKSGVQVPYQTVSQQGTQTQFKDIALLLEVTPSITPDGKVTMDLNVAKDSISQILPDGVAAAINQIKTKVQVNNGETVVLGGVFENSKGNNVTRVPFFSDLPVVGNLFKRTAKVDDKNELLIFITPRIVSDNSTGR